MEEIEKPLAHDPLSFLKEFTAARIAIGSTGNSIPVQQQLDFKLAHANARDAVYSVMDIHKLKKKLQVNLPIIELHSKAADRAQYLQRPDLGRQLDKASSDILKDQITGADVVLVVADGLSAIAINDHVVKLLNLLIPKMVNADLKLAPICLVQQGRVAVADEVAHILKAKLSVILIGERPGLSASDSLGAYITYKPKPGLTDDSRNCISNIRPHGLDIATAVNKIFYLVQEAFKHKLSGVALKDNERLIGP